MTETSGLIARPDGNSLAYRSIAGAGPCILWLGGFGSDMAGTKAQALADWAAARGRAFLRFDYFGHGQSSGELAQGTIGRWREDALAVLDELALGPVVLVGSSMGGWIGCLLALARPAQVKGMVLVAPAADFTERLIGPALPPEALEEIRTRGVWIRPSPYEPGGLPISRVLMEDGERWSILPGPLDIEVPLRILQGGRDEDVPWRHALALFEAIGSQDAVFTLIRDGDHRLSRPQDIARIIAAVAELS